LEKPRSPSPLSRTTTSDAAPAIGPGLSCPMCGSRIEVTLESLLAQVAFHCRTPACRTVLRLDRRGSAEALDTARRLKERLDAARPKS